MGREGDGIEIRGQTIRIAFTHEGERKRPILKVGDAPMRPTKANQTYAKRLVEEIRAKIKAGNFVMQEYFAEEGKGQGTALTVASQLDTWLGTKRIANSSKLGYIAACNFWKTTGYNDKANAALGNVPLRQIKPSYLLTALARRPELSGKTINNYTSCLRGALELAVKDGVLQFNPAEQIESSSWQQDPPDVFSPEEREKIIAYAQKHYPGHVANMIRFWFWSGLRTGELLGLRWTNINLNKNTALIKESRVRREEKTTKTNMARVLRLNSEAKAALQAQFKLTGELRDKVFHDPRTNKGWDIEQNFRTVYWRKILKALELHYRRPYQCRHTYATAMLMAGMNPKFCAGQLGHDIKVFLEIYTTWIGGDADDREMARLEANLNQFIAPPVPQIGVSSELST